jgi:hypothetical protein
MKQYNKINNLVGWLTFAVAAFTYCMTIEPTASFWDCPEFITTGYKLEVGHPPGAPFFMLTANLFSQFASDATQVAKMVNIMSALMSAACILFLFWSITHLTKKLICPDKDAKLLISKPKGLLIAEYCRYMKSKSFVKIIMTACGFIDEIYKNSNYKKKVVITVGTLDLLDSTVNFLRKKYTNLNVGEYSTNIKSPDKRLAQITENDIIVSTEKLFAKCSNTDVEMIINCVPLYYNEVFCDLFGQLKKYERYHLAKFVQIVDLGFPSYIAMMRENVSMLNYEIKNFKSITAVSLTNTSNELFDFINEK